MAINKVVYNNETLIDISSDTVGPATLAYGVTAHDASGNSITGTADMSGSATIPTKVSDLENDLNFIQNGTTDNVTLNGIVAIPVGNFLKTVRITRSASITVDGNDAASADFSYSQSDIGTGWTAISISGYSTGDNRVFVSNYGVNGLGITLRLRNVVSSQRTVTPSVTLLCVRTNA